MGITVPAQELPVYFAECAFNRLCDLDVTDAEVQAVYKALKIEASRMGRPLPRSVKFPLSLSAVRRLDVGRIAILYEIDEALNVVHVHEL